MKQNFLIIISVLFLWACQTPPPESLTREELKKVDNPRDYDWAGNLTFDVFDLHLKDGRIFHLVTLKKQGIHEGENAPLVDNHSELITVVREMAAEKICAFGVLKADIVEIKKTIFDFEYLYKLTDSVSVECL